MRTLVILICLFATVGCKTQEGFNKAAHSQSTNSLIVARNNSASLLYAIVSEEKHLSKLLIIKRDRKELHDLVKKISETSATTAKLLEDFAKEDAQFDLKQSNLPPAEIAARELQSKALTKQLLHNSGPEFEFQLLLTQAQALGYAQALATVTAANEPDVKRRGELTKISSNLTQLYEAILQMLRKH